MKELKKLTKYGQFMYNLCMKTGKFFIKHPLILFVVNITWNIVMFTIGFVVGFFLWIFGIDYRFKKGFIIFNIGRRWGGLSLGCIVIRDRTSTTDVDYHEIGHIHQAILGILYPFLVAIPSAIRYWYWTLKYLRHNLVPDALYDDMWFERSATDLGKVFEESLIWKIDKK